MKTIVPLFKLHGMTERRTRNIEYRMMIGSFFDGDLSKIFHLLLLRRKRANAKNDTSSFLVRCSIFGVQISGIYAVDGRWTVQFKLIYA
jgi:hypothetical protein